MNIVDYASLKAGVADYLNRSDLAARIPDFIGLAEVWMVRKLRTRLLEADAITTAPTGSREINLPSDYREPLNFWWNNAQERRALRFVPPGLMVVSTAAGRPEQWTIDGSSIGFERPCGQDYSFTLRYRKAFSLTDEAPTNAILTTYPDIYLAATMAEAAVFLKDDVAEERWITRRGHLEHDIREQEGRHKSLVTLSSDVALLNQHGRHGYNIHDGF